MFRVRMLAGNEQLALNSVCRRLALLRNGVILVLAAAIGVVHYGLEAHLPIVPMAVGVLVLIGLNALVYGRISRGAPVTRGVVFTQLLTDVAVLTALLYCAGGSSNPFVSFYLLPLVVTAVALPRRYAVAMAVITVSCYSGLLYWHVPLPAQLGRFQLHVIGMWGNFVISAGLIAFFVAQMAAALRARERELARAREQALRDQHIVALGTLAAGAAHELATPLSTMAVVTREMEHAVVDDAEQVAQLQCLDEQIARCKTTLARLREHGAGQPRRWAADEWLRSVADEWRLLRPATPLHYDWAGPQPAPQLCCDEDLTRTLTNLLNNAADASPAWVALHGRVTARELVIDIQDDGNGVAAAIRACAHHPGTTTKTHGHGLGLVLAKATVARLGGHLQWFDRHRGGICTRLALPLATAELE